MTKYERFKKTIAYISLFIPYSVLSVIYGFFLLLSSTGLIVTLIRHGLSVLNDPNGGYFFLFPIVSVIYFVWLSKLIKILRKEEEKLWSKVGKGILGLIPFGILAVFLFMVLIGLFLLGEH